MPGFKPPPPIGKHKRRPDVKAVKGTQQELVEVETPETLNAHKDQQSTFKRSAAHRKNTKFKIVVAE